MAEEFHDLKLKICLWRTLLFEAPRTEIHETEGLRAICSLLICVSMQAMDKPGSPWMRMLVKVLAQLTGGGIM